MSYRHLLNFFLFIFCLLSPLVSSGGGTNSPGSSANGACGNTCGQAAAQNVGEQRPNAVVAQAPQVTVTEIPASPSPTFSTVSTSPMMNRVVTLPVHNASDIANVNKTLSIPVQQATLQVNASLLVDSSVGTQQKLDQMIQNAKHHSATSVHLFILNTHDNEIAKDKALDAALKLTQRHNIVFEPNVTYPPGFLAKRVNALPNHHLIRIYTRYINDPKEQEAPEIVKAVNRAIFVTPDNRQIKFINRPHQLITYTYDAHNKLLTQEHVDRKTDVEKLKLITAVILSANKSEPQKQMPHH